MVITFDRPVFTAMESDVDTDIVIIMNGSSDYTRTVRIIGTIQNGVDVTRFVDFSPGNDYVELIFPLVDDDVAWEETEQYPLSIEIPTGQTGVVLGEDPNSILEVVDDDGKPTCYDLIVCDTYVCPFIVMKSLFLSLSLFLSFSLYSAEFITGGSIYNS